MAEHMDEAQDGEGKVGLRACILDEKKNMNKIRYIMNYRIAPAYVLVSIVIMIVVGVLMETDEVRYTPAAIALFALFGLVTVLLLLSVPFVRKREIDIEMRRYNFDETGAEDDYVFTGDDTLSFDANGMTFGGEFYWYNHLTVYVGTSNRLNRVWISIFIRFNQNQYIQLPFCENTIELIRKYPFKLANPQVSDYIVEHKREAFTQIYKFGAVRHSGNSAIDR